mmetsp:Transcript_25262/g.33804  ORF Transcript_25262/g.33804 Transcript_25262/m.33804 type:complete len:97 (+) Transcript_25262:1885-2175(+)
MPKEDDNTSQSPSEQINYMQQAQEMITEGGQSDEDQDGGKLVKDERSVRILLVDDQVFNLIVLENLIIECFPNATIDTALNGKIALDKVIEEDKAG